MTSHNPKRNLLHPNKTHKETKKERIYRSKTKNKAM